MALRLYKLSAEQVGLILRRQSWAGTRPAIKFESSQHLFLRKNMHLAVTYSKEWWLWLVMRQTQLCKTNTQIHLALDSDMQEIPLACSSSGTPQEITVSNWLSGYWLQTMPGGDITFAQCKQHFLIRIQKAIDPNPQCLQSTCTCIQNCLD